MLFQTITNSLLQNLKFYPISFHNRKLFLNFIISHKMHQINLECITIFYWKYIFLTNFFSNKMKTNSNYNFYGSKQKYHVELYMYIV